MFFLLRYLFTPINYSLHMMFNWTVNQDFSESDLEKITQKSAASSGLSTVDVIPPFFIPNVHPVNITGMLSSSGGISISSASVRLAQVGLRKMEGGPF